MIQMDSLVHHLFIVAMADLTDFNTTVSLIDREDLDKSGGH